MIGRLVPAVLLFPTLVLAGLLGGNASILDRAAVRHFVEWRASYPDATSALIILTQLGGAPVLLVAAAAAALVVVRRSRSAAFALLTTSLGGRLLIEFTKLAVGRPRPALDAHPVFVFSQSFPSAHAGNTMITYGAIALFAVPERWRPAAFAAAVAISLAVGVTRPVLGVHWPTDVIGGWCLGLLWLLACRAAWARLSPRT